MITSKPTAAKAKEAARNFIRNKDKLGKWATADLLAGLGRHYEFPAATPAYTGPLEIAAIAAFIQTHAVEME